MRALRERTGLKPCSTAAGERLFRFLSTEALFHSACFVRQLRGVHADRSAIAGLDLRQRRTALERARGRIDLLSPAEK